MKNAIIIKYVTSDITSTIRDLKKKTVFVRCRLITHSAMRCRTAVKVRP